MEADEDSGGYGAEAPETSLPSCDSCRVRKLKCSREQPSCSNCIRLKLSCVYDSERSKPGLKRGTVERLSKRIELLERKLLQNERTSGVSSNSTASQVQPSSTSSNDVDLENSQVPILSVFAEGMAKLSSEISHLSQAISVIANSPDEQPRKRPRLDEQPLLASEPLSAVPVLARQASSTSPFLMERYREALVDTYFRYVHPWIPMIHMASFRRRMKDIPDDDPPLLLHAMLVGALRFIDPTGEHITKDRIEQAVKYSRERIILAAATDLSVENLQALIIVAFSHVGDGEPMKAWPLVASLSRMVDFLHLNTEEDDKETREAILMPKTLPQPADWMEEEERRRVFWNIFILDRICSITTGWNVGLTADNVWRRLPICGTHWNEDNPALSPFFGMWDKSAAKIGNSVAFLPAHYPSPGQSTEASGADFEVSLHPNQKQRQPAAPIDMSTIGAFAYYVESLESLCRVDMYFLRQKIDFNNRQEVSSWLTRFKELDLRLVHWKMFLPSKWKDPNVPPEATTALDPNMSLAHITHNTSMILLHQRIGYPTPELKAIKLPSFYSAETCQSAAIETMNIAQKYLTHAPVHMLLSPHFSFCIYISARALIVHSRYYGVQLDPQFLGLIECLHVISRRWVGSLEQNASDTFSSKFAKSLEEIYERYQQDTDFTINVVGSVNVKEWKGRGQHVVMKDAHPAIQASPIYDASGAQVNFVAPPAASSARHSHASLSETSPVDWRSPSNAQGSMNARRSDELSTIIQTFTDERFTEMDRVICFDDFHFEVETGGLDAVAPTDMGLGWNAGLQGWAADGAAQ